MNEKGGVVPEGVLSNQDIDLILSTYPDEVADAQEAYRRAEAETKRMAGKLYLQFKAVNTGKDLKETHIKSLVANDPAYYTAQMAEIVAEAKYTRLYETLMSAKKLAGLRTAF